ncbi:MAG: EAL domain-containing protein, partial [Pseudomonadota bacterium]
ELLIKDYEAKATEWIWQTDAKGRVTAAPDLIFQFLGGAEEMADRAVLHRVGEKISTESAAEFERMADAVRNRAEFHDIVLAFPDEDQVHGLRWLAVKGRPQFDRGTFQGFRGIIADATKATEAERQVKQLAAYDNLTGLLNRNSVNQRLGALDPERDQATAFLIDLDGFKQINDSYGHDIGDKLLEGASDRLRSLATGGAWAARLAGDEFLLVVPDDTATSADERLTLGQEVCDRLSEPFQLTEFELQISASVGIARFPSDTDNAHHLLSLCDLALYAAKGMGRDRAHLFDPAMLEQLNKRIAVIERLKHAVREGHLRLHYQPQHRLSDGRLIGFEALARWDDEDLGRVGPDVFIPIAEQTGLIVELGEQLLRTACTDAMGWFQTLGDQAPIVSVNVSPVQFARTDVSGLIQSVLDETGLPAALFEVEVTEGVLISDKTRVAKTLAELSARGVSIALDDFGTGYSSLSYLKELPLNRLKIDRSFVSDLEESADSPIVSTVIQLGHNLNLNVIAEGVETATQIEHLLQMGCDEGQGYHFGRPMSVPDVNEYVARYAQGVTLGKTV